MSERSALPTSIQSEEVKANRCPESVASVVCTKCLAFDLQRHCVGAGDQSVQKDHVPLCPFAMEDYAEKRRNGWKRFEAAE